MAIVTDVRTMTREMRKDVLDKWFKRHLDCLRYNRKLKTWESTGGHSWKNHRWNQKLKVWVWGPCTKCNMIRITQTNCNCMEINKGYVDRVLIVNDEFEDWKQIAKKAMASLFFGVAESFLCC